MLLIQPVRLSASPNFLTGFHTNHRGLVQCKQGKLRIGIVCPFTQPAPIGPASRRGAFRDLRVFEPTDIFSDDRDIPFGRRVADRHGHQRGGIGGLVGPVN